MFSQKLPHPGKILATALHGSRYKTFKIFLKITYSYLGFQFSGTSIRFTTQNLYRILACLNPPAPPRCAQICRQGFEDALRFLTKNGKLN